MTGRTSTRHGARLRAGAATVAVLLTAAYAGWPAAASAAVPLTLVVDRTVDEPDTSPGDGVCQAVNGGCTLRAAVEEANANPGHDRIAFPPLSPAHKGERLRLTRAGAGEDQGFLGDLDVTDDVTIAGNGARWTMVDGRGLAGGDRVFDVDPAGAGIVAELSGLTVTGGAVTGAGGAVRTLGVLRLDASTLTGNTATGNGGGLAVESPTARAELTTVTIKGNETQRSGGGVANRGTLLTNRSTVAGNRAAGDSGGVFTGGVARFSATTISGNHASGNAGGLPAGGLLTSGNSVLENVTISGNTGDPGGLLVGGPTSLVNVTIAGNTGGLINLAAAGGTVRAVNTIVADSAFVPGVNCYGPVVSLGHNLEDSASCGFTAAGDLQHANPGLASLAYSIGPTRTHALAVTSPAVDAGDPARCPATDQRGVPRPQGARCDIGAFERQTDSYVVNSPVDAVDAQPGNGICETAVPTQCTLRAAVMEANARPGPDQIRVGPARIPLIITGAGEDAAATGDLDVTDDLTVIGGGHAATVIGGVGRRLGDRVWHALGHTRPGVSVMLEGLTIENGNPPTTEDGGNVLVGDYLEPAPPRMVMHDVEMRNGLLGSLSHGGNIANNGDLEASGSIVRGGRASAGGGVSGNRASTTALTDVAVTGNTATDVGGGGIYVEFDAYADLLRTRIAGNAATDPTAVGGGIWSGGTLHVTESALTGNTAPRWGGGLFTDLGTTTTVTASTLETNTTGAGGGAFNLGAMRVTGSTFAGNLALVSGGGINTGTGSLIVLTSTFSGNDGTTSGGGIRNTSGTTTVTATTLHGNTAATGSSIVNGAGAALTIGGTVLDGAGANCSGVLTSAGHNLDRGVTCGLAGTGDLSGQDPLLGPLAANGGPTATHELLAGSPAIDAGPAAPACAGLDQRGTPRPQGAACDIGAVEMP
ncbi:choice-of-anchor Q domain-containing protein [Actinoplanes sp. CA-142083]|uniref:choice-of-anchor Q domain-containing protein n=1 Tax=Actinoplanes sp. CA-142083 TaxID=3239903 RepID=UPI003D8AF968